MYRNTDPYLHCCVKRPFHEILTRIQQIYKIVEIAVDTHIAINRKLGFSHHIQICDRQKHIVSDGIDMNYGDGSRGPSLNLGNKIFFSWGVFPEDGENFILLYTESKNEDRSSEAAMGGGGRAALNFTC
jgi:hypothetical protein